MVMTDGREGNCDADGRMHPGSGGSDCTIRYLFGVEVGDKKADIVALDGLSP